MALDGFIFDLDGVLIDSNQAHVEAWQRAFDGHGYHVERDRIFTAIGKGGDKVVAHVLGDEAEQKRGDDLREAEKSEYRRLALERGLRVAPGAVELIAELGRRGLKTALATSSAMEQLEVAERASGVKWRSLMDEVVSASEVAETKPAPDLVRTAVEKLGLTAAQCTMIGDTPWDAQSASRAGVTLLAVTRGGNPVDVLLRGGARAVYRDPADVLANLDEALRRASPGSARLDRALLADLMNAALAEAERALMEAELPIGCVITDGAGGILSAGHDRRNHSRSRLAHAELEALRGVAGKAEAGTRDMLLVCTLEPCVMCLGAAIEAGVDTIAYGLAAGERAGSDRVAPTGSQDERPPRILGGVQAEASRELFDRWLRRPAGAAGTAESAESAKSNRQAALPMSLSSVIGKL